MDEFIQKLISLFQQQFSGSDAEFEKAGARGVGSLLVWDGFTGQSQIERQRTVWKMLRSNLTPEEQTQISAVLTLTPEEMTAARSA